MGAGIDRHGPSGILSRTSRLLTSDSRTTDSRFVGLAALVYCVFAIWLTARNSPWIAGDSVRYLELSQAILKGQFGLMHNACLTQRPGDSRISAFLALGSLVFGKSRLALIILQHGMSFTAILLAYFVVRGELSPAAARIFLILCSIYPFIAEATAKFLTESLCLFLISASLLQSPIAGPGARTSPGPNTNTLLGIVRLVRQSLKRLRIQCSYAVGDRHVYQAGAGRECIVADVVTLLGIITLVRLGQSKNVSSPMLVTLVGIVTLSGSSKQRTPCYRCW